MMIINKGTITLPKRSIADMSKNPIRISNAAYMALTRIQSHSNLSLKELASRIIVQAKDIITYI